MHRHFDCQLVSKRRYRIHLSNGLEPIEMAISRHKLQGLIFDWELIANGAQHTDGRDQVSRSFSRGTLKTISAGVGEMVATGSHRWTL